jgi:hypothetical protein
VAELVRRRLGPHPLVAELEAAVASLEHTLQPATPQAGQ